MPMTTLPSQPHTATRQGLSLLLCRVAVLAVGLLTVTLFVTGVPGWYEDLVSGFDVRSVSNLGTSASTVAFYVVALAFVVVVAHGVIASFIFWRKPRDWMVVFMSLALVTNGAIIPLSQARPGNADHAIWLSLATLVIFLGLATSLMILFLFPDHGFVPRWTLIPAAVWTFLTLVALFWPDSVLSLWTMPALLRAIILCGFAAIGALAQSYRYRRAATLSQRQQIKWSLLGLTAAALGPVMYFLSINAVAPVGDVQTSNLLYQRAGAGFFTISFGVRLIWQTLFAAFLLVIPTTFAIAILRYRLWDIDIIIRRTVVYAALTGALVLVYVTVVVAAELVFFLVLRHSSPVAVVISTLAVAALFAPLRHRIQNAIDRHFFRRKYDAEQVLARFAQTARDETDLDSLTAELARVVQETMQPQQVSVWLRTGEKP